MFKLIRGIGMQKLSALWSAEAWAATGTFSSSRNSSHVSPVAWAVLLRLIHMRLVAVCPLARVRLRRDVSVVLVTWHVLSALGQGRPERPVPQSAPTENQAESSQVMRLRIENCANPHSDPGFPCLVRHWSLLYLLKKTYQTLKLTLKLLITKPGFTSDTFGLCGDMIVRC